MTDFNLSDMYRMHWAQPVEQQVAADIANMTDEQRMLEGWLNDSPKCESAHTWVGNEHCSQTVTHREHIDCENRDLNVCQSHIVSLNRRCASGDRCGTCLERARDCWSVRPI